MKQRVYRLPKHVRVRREEFGLLFYSSQTTNLTFVNSGTLLSPDALKLGEPLSVDGGDEERIAILDRLVGKGLLVEQ